MEPTLEQLGLPEDRGYVSADLGGTYPPGASLEFAVGIHDGIASVRRNFAWVLAGERGEIARAQAGVGSIAAHRPIRLVVRVPDDAPADYRLTLEIDDRVLEWPVRVPEQRIETRFVCEPEMARRGETITATLHNDGPSELFFGEPYGIERLDGDTWLDVDAFDGDENIAWPAIGYELRPGGTFDVGFDVPRLTEPGLHRVVKHVSAFEAGIADARLTAEFTVEA